VGDLNSSAVALAFIGVDEAVALRARIRTVSIRAANTSSNGRDASINVTQ
jgi:hypothetical protein